MDGNEVKVKRVLVLVFGGFVTQGTIVLDGLIGLRVGTAHPF